MSSSTESRSTLDVDAPGWQFAVTAGILGWVLDAFDFFVVIFLVDTLAICFSVEKKAIVWTISIALAMRPVGALVFGALADRFGRRVPLAICVLYFSSVTLLSALAPNYAAFAALRAFMELAWEDTGAQARRLPWRVLRCTCAACYPGLMQAGYPVGILACRALGENGSTALRVARTIRRRPSPCVAHYVSLP